MLLAQSKSSRWSFVPAHKHGRAQALQNLLFFLGKGSTVVVILSALNRLIDMDCHPFFVFGKRRVRLLEIAEFPRFVRRTRCVGEERPEFGCFGAVLLRSEQLHPLSTAGGSTTGLLLAGAVGCTDWSILDAYGDDHAN